MADQLLESRVYHRAQRMVALYGAEAASESLLRSDAAEKYCSPIVAEFWLRVANAISTASIKASLSGRVNSPEKNPADT